MSYRLPNITAADPAGQVQQLKGYLYQLVQELNRNADNLSVRTSLMKVKGNSGAVEESAQQSERERIKSLIISSADIVNAYYDIISKRLVGNYEALSDYGDFKEETQSQLFATSTKLEALFNSFQRIITEEGEDTVYVSAYLRAGKLIEENGVPIYGLEVGQTTADSNGDDEFSAFARFTAGELSFFDGDGTKVAWITGYVLHITSVEILGNMMLGGYLYDTSDGVIHRWAGS